MKTLRGSGSLITFVGFTNFAIRKAPLLFKIFCCWILCLTFVGNRNQCQFARRLVSKTESFIKHFCQIKLIFLWKYVIIKENPYKTAVKLVILNWSILLGVHYEFI